MWEVETSKVKFKQQVSSAWGPLVMAGGLCFLHFGRANAETGAFGGSGTLTASLIPTGKRHGPAFITVSS
jgi:hypothetical protein